MAFVEIKGSLFDEASRLRLYKDRDNLTRLLCEAMQHIEEFGSFDPDGLMPPVSNELNDWWIKHQEADRVRKEKEAAEALAKSEEYKLYLQLHAKYAEAPAPSPIIGPHSRACGIHKHDHGPACSWNCPTCGGKDA
jgi:hypothetical protein